MYKPEAIRALSLYLKKLLLLVGNCAILAACSALPSPKATPVVDTPIESVSGDVSESPQTNNVAPDAENETKDSTIYTLEAASEIVNELETLCSGAVRVPISLKGKNVGDIEQYVHPCYGEVDVPEAWLVDPEDPSRKISSIIAAVYGQVVAQGAAEKDGNNNLGPHAIRGNKLVEVFVSNEMSAASAAVLGITIHAQEFEPLNQDSIDNSCKDSNSVRVVIPNVDMSLGEFMNLGVSSCLKKPYYMDQALLGGVLSQLHNQGAGLVTLDGSWPGLAARVKVENLVMYVDPWVFDFVNHTGVEGTVHELTIEVVFDKNGDAVKNEGEYNTPVEGVVEGAEICLIREESGIDDLCGITNANGLIVFPGIPPGTWPFRAKSPMTGDPLVDRLEAYRHLNFLIEKDKYFPEHKSNGFIVPARYLNVTNFTGIDEVFNMTVYSDGVQHVFMMKGWASALYTADTKHLFYMMHDFDLDIKVGQIRVYDGSSKYGLDNHDGLDLGCPIGTEVVAIAEGIVQYRSKYGSVGIEHSNGLVSNYGHGDPLVSRGAYVPRGYPVIKCNMHHTDVAPHVHNHVYVLEDYWGSETYSFIPPFADLVYTEPYWVQNSFPRAQGYEGKILVGGRGIWIDPKTTTETGLPLPYVRMEDN